MPLFPKQKSIVITQNIPFLWLRKGDHGVVVGRCDNLYEVEVVRSSGRMQLVPLEQSDFKFV